MLIAPLFSCIREGGHLYHGAVSRASAARDLAGALGGVLGGIFDLQFQPVGHERTLDAIELFGRQVLPRLHEI
jgi:hypothetical protein